MPADRDTRLRRLTRRAQFLRAARGNKIARRGFVLQAAPVDDERPGIGYTVTKKIGNAPERNRIKRRLRAAAAQCEGRFVAGHDYVLIGRRPTLSEPFEALVAGLNASLSRLHSPKGRDRIEPAADDRRP